MACLIIEQLTQFSNATWGMEFAIAHSTSLKFKQQTGIHLYIALVSEYLVKTSSHLCSTIILPVGIDTMNFLGFFNTAVLVLQMFIGKKPPKDFGTKPGFQTISGATP